MGYADADDCFTVLNKGGSWALQGSKEMKKET